ncbi:hypothetical protein DL768_009328 [Monosporascus sp. mg162]|nr:hypothetical protein DL768_009328 [Monosporascus sp. mg162]
MANADSTNERKLFGSNSSTFDYHASFSPDGKRHRPGATPGSSSFENAGALGPDGTKLAYVSTANGYKANIWVMGIATKEAYNLTDVEGVKAVETSPDGYFRPAWSPDGEWLAFASDRNTQWTGHDNGTGWEHTQQLSIYIIRPNGSDFRQIASKDDYSLGSPKWSSDGTRIVYYEIARQATWDAHRPEHANSTSAQIISVDIATGLDRIEHTSGLGVKMFPQYVTDTVIGFIVKGSSEGVNYTSHSTNFTTQFLRSVRSPLWSADGKTDSEWEYRFTDVFPTLSRQGKMAITQKQLGNSPIVTMNPDGSGLFKVFGTLSTGKIDPSLPGWSPDGERIAFTRKMNATNFDVCTIRPDGTDLQILTSSGANDVHAVWTGDSPIAYSGGMYGFRDECAIYDNTFQPYGQIIVKNTDGSNKTMLTDSMWEDSMSLYVPNEFLI